MSTTEVKAASVLMLVVDQRNNALREVIQMGAQDAGLPVGSRLDIGRGVWVVPVPEAEPEK